MVLRRYARAVTVLGLAAGVLAVLVHGDLTLSAVVVVLGLATLIAELKPVVIARSDGNQEVEVSNAFVLALLLVAGPATAVVAQFVSSGITNVVRRRAPIKALFNVGQKTGSAACAGFAFTAVAGAPALGGSLDAAELAAFVLAAAAYAAVNETTVVVACALAERRALLPFLLENTKPAVFSAAASGMALVVAPAALLGWWIVPLMVMPLWALHSTARMHLEVYEQSRRDALTGLPNAVALRVSLHEAADRRDLAIAMFDLDSFKDINDTLGHDTGDAVLRAVAERLAEATRGRGTAHRLQGDEFVVLLDSAEAEDALDYASEMTQSFHEAFAVGDLELEVGLTGGVATARRGELTTDELLRRADVAMLQAKRHRTGFALYGPRSDDAGRARQLVTADLRRALASGELEVHYQPQLSLRTGAIESTEALVRWRRPDGTLVLPGDFIPQAELTNVILPLTVHVLRTAIADCRRWYDEHGYMGRLAVNLSARTLHHPALVTEVRSALAESGIDAQRLELEITESALMADPDGARRTLQALHDLGVAILIDDFGTGFSSLAYLSTLPVDGIKVDRAFVAGMATEHADLVIVRSTIDLGANLGLRTVAEGVEDEMTRDALVSLGCELAQGWLWHRAMSADTMGAALAAPSAARLAA